MTKQYGTPGPRAIYPEIVDSRSLARCGLVANALFPRLLAQADDQGRLAGGAVDILVQCMGRLLGLPEVTAASTQEALEELESAGMVRQYQVRGESYLQLLGWWTWQRSSRRAYPSRWPGPPRWHDMVYGIEGSPSTWALAAELVGQSAAGRRDSRYAAANRSQRARTRAQPSPAQNQPSPSSPPPPSAPSAPRGRRATGESPRQRGRAPRDNGSNPRANGASPRQERQAEKTGPTALREVMAEIGRRQAAEEADRG